MNSPPKNRHGVFTWFELVCDAIDPQQEFYCRVLQWSPRQMSMLGHTYSMLAVHDAPQAGLVPPTREGTSHWLSYLSVDDVDARVARVVEHGGAVVEPPHDMPGVGRLALITDPRGARVMVFRGINDNGSTHFHWNELWSSDPERDLSFYCTVFDLGVQTMQMPDSPYYILTNEEGGQGGVMARPKPDDPSGWIPYVRLDDCDAAVERATSQGGEIIIAPMTAEGIGRLAVVRDHGGACLGLITPAS